MPDYLYEDERGNIIITPRISQRRGEGVDNHKWNAGDYFLRKEVPDGAVSRDFHDGRGLTFDTEEEALRVTIQLAEERIEWGYDSLFEDDTSIRKKK